MLSVNEKQGAITMPELLSSLLWYAFAAIVLVLGLTGIFSGTQVKRRRRIDGWESPSWARQPNGKPIDETMVFFVAPPAYLGTILFAQSELTSKTTFQSFGRRLVTGLIYCAIGFGLGLLTVSWGGLFNSPWKWLWLIVPTAGFMVIGWYQVPVFCCTYIGIDGVLQIAGFPPGKLLLLRPRISFTFLRVKRMQVTHDKQRERYTWYDEYGHVVYQLQIPLALRSDIADDLRTLANAIVQGWKIARLNRALRIWQIVTESDVVMSKFQTVDEDPEDTIEIDDEEIRFRLQGDRYVLETKMDSCRFREWPLMQHLQAPVLREIGGNDCSDQSSNQPISNRSTS